MKYNFKIALIVIMISLKCNQLESMVNSYKKSDDQSLISTDYEDMYSSISPTKQAYIHTENNGNFYENVIDALHNYFTTPTDEAQENIDSTPEVTSLTDSQDTKNNLYDYLFEEEKKEEITDAISQPAERTIDRILNSAINNPDKGMQAAVNFILSGSEVNDQNNATKTSPLHFAIKYNAYKLAVVLIAARANINTQDIDGYTPLHTAVIYHHNNDTTNESIKTLLNAKANLHIQDKDGKTAAKIAQELNMTSLYDLIAQAAVSRLID